MNIADDFSIIAKNYPEKIAIIVKDQSLSFDELNSSINQFARGLRSIPHVRGKKVLVFLKPSAQFPAIVFALFKVGAIPIFIDPGMGLKNLLQAIKEIGPEIMIAEPIVYALRLLHKDAFSSLSYHFCNGMSFGKTVKNIAQLYHDHKSDQAVEEEKSEDLLPDELCAILFTSGGTGTPKGVEYTHKIFSTQTKLLQQLFSLTPKDVDIPGFPLFSLFALNMGLTSCPPPMNPAKPAKANAKKLVDWITQQRGTFVAGSPAIWERVADYCLAHQITLPSVKYLVMFGAPVSIELHQKFKKILTHGKTYTPYGATESLPISCISGDEVLEQTASCTNDGKGTCVGTIVPHVQVKIIRPTNDAIPDLRETEELPVNTPGEIIVSGDVVTAKYFGRAKETMRAKIYHPQSDGSIRLWHRIGDMGYLDHQGRLWFLGRASHAIKIADTYHFSIACEAIFNRHPQVKRSALIEIFDRPKSQLAVVIERVDKKVLCGYKQKKFEEELRSLAKEFPHTQEISQFFYHSSFPVDVRHNIKIDRLKLRDHFNKLKKLRSQR